MDRDYWHKQTSDEPLFPDLLWSRPENKRQAGKLLIIGGNKFGFAAPAAAYQASLDAGIGRSKVLLPDALRKTVGQHLEAAEFAPTSPSGSFNRQALGEFLELADWSDGVLLAGDLGRNSETAILLESFFQKYNGQLTITKDAVDYTYALAGVILSRANTTLVLSLSQLQKLARASGSPKPVTFSMDLLRLIDFLHEFTSQHQVNIVVKHLDSIIVACGGKISTTKTDTELLVWRLDTASRTAVWNIQHPKELFRSTTTAVTNPKLHM